MKAPKEAALLRIFVGEADRWNGRPTWYAIVLKAREMRLAGATVLRGPLGYGRSKLMHSSKILQLSDNLPVVVEIVDSEENLAAFLPELEGLMESGLVTLEKVRVIQYGPVNNGDPATPTG